MRRSGPSFLPTSTGQGHRPPTRPSPLFHLPSCFLPSSSSPTSLPNTTYLTQLLLLQTQPTANPFGLQILSPSSTSWSASRVKPYLPIPSISTPSWRHSLAKATLRDHLLLLYLPRLTLIHFVPQAPTSSLPNCYVGDLSRTLATPSCGSLASTSRGYTTSSSVLASELA